MQLDLCLLDASSLKNCLSRYCNNVAYSDISPLLKMSPSLTKRILTLSIATILALSFASLFIHHAKSFADQSHHHENCEYCAAAQTISPKTPTIDSLKVIIRVAAIISPTTFTLHTSEGMNLLRIRKGLDPPHHS